MLRMRGAGSAKLGGINYAARFNGGTVARAICLQRDGWNNGRWLPRWIYSLRAVFETLLSDNGREILLVTPPRSCTRIKKRMRKRPEMRSRFTKTPRYANTARLINWVTNLDLTVTIVRNVTAVFSCSNSTLQMELFSKKHGVRSSARIMTTYLLSYFITRRW